MKQRVKPGNGSLSKSLNTVAWRVILRKLPENSDFLLTWNLASYMDTGK